MTGELCRGVHGAADTRIELALDLCSRVAAAPPTLVVLKVYKPQVRRVAPLPVISPCKAHRGWRLQSSPQNHPRGQVLGSSGSDVSGLAAHERAALSRCAHPHVLAVLDYFIETSDHTHEEHCTAAETLDPACSVLCTTPGLTQQSDSVAQGSRMGGGLAKAKFSNHVVVLEHAPGGSVDHYLRGIAAAGGISASAAVDLCDQLFTALAHCHSPAIATAHRDIKPANCVLFPTTDPHHRSGWLLKLSDFGLAKTVASYGADEARKHRSLETFTFDLGTEPYQSPEICGLRYHPDGRAVALGGEGKGEGYDPFQSDLWSLGCTVYEICTLQLACRCAPDAALATAAFDHCDDTHSPAVCRNGRSLDTLTHGALCPPMHAELTSARAAQGVRNDDSCAHCLNSCRWLKQASIPALPPPPLFAEELGSTAPFDTAATDTETEGQLSIVDTLPNNSLCLHSLP